MLPTHNASDTVPDPRVQEDQERPPKLSFNVSLLVILSMDFAVFFGFEFLFFPLFGVSTAVCLIVLIGTPVLSCLLASALWFFVHRQSCSQHSGDLLRSIFAPAQVSPVDTEVTNTPLHMNQDGMTVNVQAVQAAAPAAPVHHHLPRPTVPPADNPDHQYLLRCAAAATELNDVLLAVCAAEQHVMRMRLRKKYHLRWQQEPQNESQHLLSFPSNGSRASQASIARPSLDAAAKVLHNLAMRYPESIYPLEQGVFEWSTPPLRGAGEAAVEWELRTWTEQTSSAADSSMFSSMGFWISPFTAPMLACGGILFAFLFGSVLADKIGPGVDFKLLAEGGVSISCFSSAAALRFGRRWLGQWLFGAGMAMSAIFYFLLAAAEASSMWAAAWRDAFLGSVCLSFASLAVFPHRTFDISFKLIPTLQALSGLGFALEASKLGGQGGLLSAAIASAGAFIWTGRARAIARAIELGDEDAARYKNLWEHTLLAQPGFGDSLSSLWTAWRHVQDNNALELRKEQNASSLFVLLRQADKLNDPLQAKLYDLCTAHRGELHGSSVKTEQRALQKIFRSYRGNWRKLCDLCRASLIFKTIADMEGCLRAMGADEELEIAKVGDEKMRMRQDFDATQTGGYRDIQLCVRLNSAEARERGVSEHLAEVQLHLASVAALKSDGGHHNYVLRRNLSGQ